jgi:DNA-binding CsgD family transcriptional regulator
MRGLIFWLQDNDLQQAKLRFESSMLLFREARCRFYNVLILLADVEQVMGNTARAQRLYEEALFLLGGNMPSHTYLPWILAGLVSVARSLRQLERAARLLGAANGVVLGTKRNSHDIANFDLGPTAVAAVRDQLGENAFGEAWAAGNAMTPAQIVVYALEDRNTRMEMSAHAQADHSELVLPASPSRTVPLNSRELEILSLVANGLSNREIASQLFVTVNTVKWYLKGIFGKLHVTNRTQAVAHAQALGVLSQG